MAMGRAAGSRVRSCGERAALRAAVGIRQSSVAPDRMVWVEQKDPSGAMGEIRIGSSGAERCRLLMRDYFSGHIRVCGNDCASEVI